MRNLLDTLPVCPRLSLQFLLAFPPDSHPKGHLTSRFRDRRHSLVDSHQVNRLDNHKVSLQLFLQINLVDNQIPVPPVSLQINPQNNRHHNQVVCQHSSPRGDPLVTPLVTRRLSLRNNQ